MGDVTETKKGVPRHGSARSNRDALCDAYNPGIHHKGDKAQPAGGGSVTQGGLRPGWRPGAMQGASKSSALCARQRQVAVS